LRAIAATAGGESEAPKNASCNDVGRIGATADCASVASYRRPFGRLLTSTRLSSRDMPHLSIERPHHLSQRQAKDVAERLARDFEGRFGLAWHWDADTIHFRRPGVSGTMHVGPATIALELSLGMLLGAMRPAIERRINAELDRLGNGSREA
jgi:putative polyhydroxyalkanoate system protein